MHSAKWVNGGMSMWNRWYGGCNVFLVRVVELAGGWFIGMQEVFILNVDEIGGWVLYA